MSRHRWLAVAVAASLSVLSLPFVSAPTAHAADFASNVPDANYRACITDKLALAPDAAPSADQLASITELSCTSRGITDVTGTSALPKLTKLFLGGNAIADVTPLAPATGLFSLGLENNQLTTIAPLAPLVRLRALTVAGNRVDDLSVLGTLPEYNAGSGTRYGQKVTAPQASIGVASMVPAIIGASGKLVSADAPEGAVVTGTTVTYPATGTYTWSFRDPDDFYFNGSVSVAVTDSGMTIPDTALRTCVNSRLSLAADVQPTLDQLAGLTGALSCANKGVRDLTGLHLITGLTGLTLNGNSISDVRPISALVNLTSANLALNEITSITALGALPKLGTIQLQQNLASTKPKLVTLAGIEGLTALTSITANYTALRSLAPAAGNASLKNLTATNNLITDVTPLAAVGGQLANVDLSGNQIADLSPLSAVNYTKLTVNSQSLTAAEAKAGVETGAPTVVKKDGSTLVATPPSGVTITGEKVTYPEPGSYEWSFSSVDNLRGVSFAGKITQQVAEAPPVETPVEVPDAGLKACLNGLLRQEAASVLTAEKLAGLSEVSCVGAGITDLSGAEHLSGATKLVLSTNTITTLTPLAQLRGLKQLYLPGNAITDPSPLAALTGLELLNLSYNPISSIASLAPLSSLTDLEVTQRSGHSGADLTSLDGVQAMTSLTRLVANNSSITSLEPVEGLTALKRLHVNNNTISDLTPVKTLTSLTNLGVNTNRIGDVSALSGLTSLTDLDLATNQILDLSPLKKLKDFGYLGLKARWQQVTAAQVPALLTVSVPQPRDHTGALVEVSPPEGVTAQDGKVRYATPGSYEWTFSASSEDGPFFSGTITQQVSEPDSEAAELPDAALRSCLAEAAGLGKDGVPTRDDLAALTEVACAHRGISDLTGADLLTSATSLDLADNPLASTAALAQLGQLVSLDLSRTGLKDVKQLDGLRGLTTVKLDGNSLDDLSPLDVLPDLATVSATGQELSLPTIAGGAGMQIPSVTTKDGEKVLASVPTGATRNGSTVSFHRAGRYLWPFSSGAFSGSFDLVVSSDVPDRDAHAGASACVAAGRVWVVVERDTGLDQGGCAKKFGTGLEALTSAGFTPTGSGLITAIDGYPSREVADSYWSYWHASKPVKSSGGIEYSWSFSETGPASHHPKAGSIEGWRFESWKTEAVAPSWKPKVTLAPTRTTLQSGKVAVGYGKPVTIPVSVSPSSATGAVTAKVGHRTFTGTLRGGKASIALPASLLRPGTHRIALGYAGDTATAAAKGTATVVVSKAVPRVTVKVKGTAKRGRTTTFVVTVRSSQATPSGKVSVTLDGRKATGKLNAKGVATVKVTKTKKSGKRKATVTYAGTSLLTKVSVKKTVSVKR